MNLLIFRNLFIDHLIVHCLEYYSFRQEAYIKMSTALIIPTLIVISLTFSSVALSLRQHEVPDDLMERGLNAIGIDANTTRVRNVRISGSQFRTKSMITTIALDGMDSTVVPYGNQTITYSYGEGGLK